MSWSIRSDCNQKRWQITQNTYGVSKRFAFRQNANAACQAYRLVNTHAATRVMLENRLS
jgi:hypothetical protein